MGAKNSTAKTTQHQATVIHHPDGSKTVHIGTPLGQSFAPIPVVPMGSQGNYGHSGLVPIQPKGQHSGLVPIQPKGQSVGNALQPIVGKSPYPAVSGCQVQDSGSWPMFCNTSMCSVPSGRYCCSQDGTSCSGACGNNPKLACPNGYYPYPCMGCSPQ